MQSMEPDSRPVAQAVSNEEERMTPPASVTEAREARDFERLGLRDNPSQATRLPRVSLKSASRIT